MILKSQQNIIQLVTRPDIVLAGPKGWKEVTQTSNGVVNKEGGLLIPVAATHGLTLPPAKEGTPGNPVQIPGVQVAFGTSAAALSKYHTCQTCGKRFTTAGYLKQHERLHTGERPHKCEQVWSLTQFYSADF